MLHLTVDAAAARLPDLVEKAQRGESSVWEMAIIHLRDFESPVVHRKLALALHDGVGVGAFALAAL